MIDISVVIPVWNSEKYLEECVQSLSQNSCDAEFIFVDDLSDDSSVKILEEFQKNDSRVKIIKSDHKLGAALARNKGIDAASGKYLMFVDSDDYVQTDSLMKIVSSMDILGLEMLYIGMEPFGSDSKLVKDTQLSIVGKYDKVYSAEEFLTEMVENSEFFLYLWSVCYRREFVEKNRIRFKNIRVGEGGEFIISALLKAECVAVLNEQVYNYRIHDASITHDANFKLNLMRGQFEQYCTVADYFFHYPDRKVCKILLDYICKKMIGGFDSIRPDERTEIRDSLNGNYKKYVFDLLTRNQYYYVERLIDYLPEIRRYKNIIIYGTGYASRELLFMLNDYQIEIIGFAVTDKNFNNKNIYGHHIYNIHELVDFSDNSLVLIAANKRYKKEIIEKLNQCGFKNYISLDVEI